MNVQLLLQICDRIAKHPEAFKMESWAEQTECGTAACVAGYACILSGVQPNFSERCTGEDDRRTATFGENEVCQFKAAELLELTCIQTRRLFFTTYRCDGWPIDYFRRYDDAKTPEERAAVAVERIHHFIKTEGRE